MTEAIRTLVVALSLAVLLSGGTAFAETITATCYSPEGKRFEIFDGKSELSDDGFSNSNPTFFFTTRDSGVLIESWQAALPFPDLINRERVDDLVSPSVIKSTVVFHSDSVIHALYMEGSDSYSTTLYMNEDSAIFTRVRVTPGGLSPRPMGAIYTATCSFSIVE